MRNRSNTPFRYRDGELFCEAVAAAAIAEEAGTPVYVYSAGHIVQQYHAFERALGKYPHLVCYAAKANSNRRVMELLAREGAGFDIVSGGELALVVHAGGAADRVVFSGVGKTATEIDDALRSRI